MRASLDAYRLNEKAAILVNHVIVAAMMVCVSYTILQLAQRLVPGWQGGYLPLLACLISIEAMFTWRTMRRWANLNIYGVAYWGVEWVVLLVLIKLFLYLAHGFDQLLADIPLLLKDFLTNFFDGETLFVLLVAFIVWSISGVYTRDLMELEGNETLLKLSDSDRFQIDYSQIRRDLVSRVFTIGFFLVLATALLQVDYTTWQVMPAIPRGELLNAMIYFLLGLVMFSQTHYTLLRTVWASDRLPISGEITKRWTLFSLIFLTIVSAIAFILPTRYSLGLLSTLNYLVNVLSMVFYFLASIIYLPILAFLNFLAGLFYDPKGQKSPIPLPDLSNMTPKAQVGGGIPWFELVKSVLLWLAICGIVGYAIYQYFLQNQELVERLRSLPVFSILFRALGKLWKLLRGVNQRLGEAALSGLQRLRLIISRSEITSRTGFIRLRRLTPRQRIQFFYLALVRRGEEGGIPRQDDQTPYEYSRLLDVQVKDVHEDLKAMTEAFVEARYSRHEITSPFATLVQRYWQRINRALRDWRRHS
jgi:hypothetical protein